MYDDNHTIPFIKGLLPMPKKNKGSKGYTLHNRVELIRGGADFFARLIQMIEHAERSIHLQVYILDKDPTGIMVTDALKRAAKRGVTVHLMADGYASRMLPGGFIRELRDAGIHFRFFEPLLKSKYFYFGRRLHHKIMVTDARYALVGGLNITERYNDRIGFSAWLDFAVWVEGEIAKQLCIRCWKTWYGFPASLKQFPCEKDFNQTITLPGTISQVRMRVNDWVRNRNEISQSYLEMLSRAKSQITILCSYFLPNETFRKKLLSAAKRGVNVRIILAGLSDIQIAKNAERYIYEWLLRNNITIYEYQGNVLHGKVAVSDSNWSTIGSYNINNISARASIELNLDVYDPTFATDLEKVLDKIIEEDCIQITGEVLQKKSTAWNRLIWWSSYQTVKGLIYLFTFYFRKKN